MSRIALLFIFVLTGLTFLFSEPASAQFITLARKIKSMKSGSKDVATVILDAGATRVFGAVIDTLQHDPKARITGADKDKKKVEFTHDSYALTLQVDSLGAGYSQITVLAEQTGDSSGKVSDIAARAILAVCHKAGVNCSLKDPSEGTNP